MVRWSLRVIIPLLSHSCVSQDNDESAERELRRAWKMVEVPGTSAGELREAFQCIRRHPVSERPERWVTVINDDRFDSSHRSLVFFEFFARHIRCPITLARLLSIAGTREWFSGDSLTSASKASQLPPTIDRSRAVFMLQPSFLAKVNAGLYLVFAEGVSLPDIRNALNTSSDAERLTILSVHR